MNVKLFTLLFTFLIATTAVFAQDRTVNDDGNYEGVIKVKFDDTMVKQLEQLHQQKSNNLNVIKATEKGYVLTANSELDSKNKTLGAYEYKRVFRYAGKFEQRHREFGLHKWYEISFDSKASVDELLKAYSSVDNIEIAEALPKMTLFEKHPEPKNNGKTLSTTPSDTRYDEQWHYNNTGQTNGTVDADIDLPEAWEVETGNSEVIVAVEDQGIDVDHEDMVGNMWINSGETPNNGVDDDNNGYVDDYHGYNFADNQGTITAGDHGSHTAGTIGAETNNGVGVAGIAGGRGNNDGVRLMSCEVFGASNQGGFDEAFVYAADMGAHISQNSWGGGGESQAINDAIDYFIANGGGAGTPMTGGVVVIAAGNSDVSSGSSIWPAAYEPAIAVAATNHEDVKSYYSNYGTWVDISAPGGETNSVNSEGVLSCWDGGYGFYQGTSMACPHVSGVAALIVSKFAGNITPEEVRSRLTTYVDDISAVNSGYTGQLGSGRLNAYAALTGTAPQPPAATYCTSKGNDASYEWIANVEIGSYSNASSGAGYTDFTSEEVQLSAGQSYNITLTPGFSNSAYDEYWKIWIDYNNDTVFDADELVYDAGSLSQSAVSGTISIPSDANGIRRMRVSMKYNGAQTACESFDYGEVEDYHVNISSDGGDTEAPTAPSNLSASNITETSVDLNWSAATDNVGLDYSTPLQDGSSIATTANTSYSVSGLAEATTYTFTVKAVDAAGNVSAASSAIDVTTNSSVDTEAPTAPTNLASGNVTETSVALSWSAATDNVGVDHYTVLQDGSSIATTANTSYSVSGLTAATTYTFTVKAVDAAGNVSAASNAIDVTTNDGSVSYCASQGNNSSYEWISQVDIGSFSNSSGAAGYSDFTGQTVNLTAGNAVDITLTPDFSGSTYNEYWKIWIDYNADGDFTDNGELVFDAGSMSSSAVSGTINVASTATGTTRMRVTMKYNGEPTSCESFSYGEVEDYTVTFGEAVVEVPVADFSANTTSIETGQSGTFSDLSTNNPTSWSWSFEGGTPSTSTSQNPAVTYSTAGTYQVSLTATNSAGSDTETKTGYITVTEGSVSYCASQGNNSSYEWIESVSFDSFTNTSGDNGGYADFTGQTITLTPGASTNVTLTPGFSGSTYTEYWVMWIDYNKDGDFTDSGEQIGSGNGSGEISGSINIDANASGTTRMRVTMKYNAAPTSCETFSYGEVEDYTVSFSGKGVTAMEELAETNISIYPQPADELVHIDMNTTSNTAEVRMYNMNGQLVKATQLDYNGQGFDLDVAGQSEGMYMLQIVTGNEIHSERIVIR